MTWVVEQVTGYDVASGPPTVAVVEALDGDAQTLYLAPTTAVAYNLSSANPPFFYNYAQPVTARYRGTVELLFDTIGSASVLDAISLVGYLTPTLSGDFNGDSIIDAADYTKWRDEPEFWGVSDYQSWSNAYGSTALDELGSAVPEPSGWVLLLTLLACHQRQRGKAK